VAGGYPGPGQQHAPYPEYQAWHPQGGPGGYPGPVGYGAAVNQADYAHVIHDAGAMAPAPSQPRMRERPPGLGEWPPVNAGHPAGAGAAARPGKPADAAGTPAGAVRAITAGAADTRGQAARVGPAAAVSSAAATPTPAAAAGTTASSNSAAQAEAMVQAGPAVPASAVDDARGESTASVDPSLAYGPDDPAYGPPGPDWYKRRQQDAADAADGEQQQDEGEAPAARGPFEPLRPGERDASGAMEYGTADDEPSLDGADDGLPDISGYLGAPDEEMPDLLDFGSPSDPEAGSLGQIKDLYLTAETISPAGLDRHFDQLLERQRQLISEYFKESGGATLADPVLLVTSEPPAPPEARPASGTPLGFDTAESLAALRGDLRSAP
jgi:hypothetical protein